MAFSAFTEVLAEKNYQDYQRVPNIQPPPPPPPQNPTGYVYPTAPGGQPGATAGGTYTAPSGTRYDGTADGSGGQGNANVTVTIPCGKNCGN